MVFLGLIAITFAATAQIVKAHDKTTAELQESELCYRTLFNQLPHPAVLIDPELMRPTAFNDKTSELLGYSGEELRRAHISEFEVRKTSDGVGAQIEKMLMAGAEEFETLMQTKRGEILNVVVGVRRIELDHRPILHCIFRDITAIKQAEEEKTKLEEDLKRSQKLETIGTLTSGVAHEFNNILTPIMGYADMARRRVSSSNPISAMLGHIVQATRRATELVDQILLFSRKTEKNPKPLFIQTLVNEAVKLLRPTIPTTIEIQKQIDTSCDAVLVDASQIHQVIVNLCVNSWHAMEENNGTLTIELKQVEVNATVDESHPNLSLGQYVRLSVTDTGSGMDEATLERIFEPFFTTKAVNKGTGMGLSVVHGIVKDHDGEILVSSELGKGSSFHVYLPAVKLQHTANAEEPKPIEGGQESLLIVDVEKAIVSLVAEMLDELGYEIDVHSSSSEALEAFRQQPNDFDLVISDLTMPGMTGLELSLQLQEIRSGTPVMIMTGYGDKLTDDTQKRYYINKVIGKPVEIRDMASAIREVLDQ